ncbi:DMT family transporter [Bosea sp. PAMC 26642]|uniref:DMT family transporter n=1 Tax=Bosea sp. (strain PAMC 26642) TaxID=1792307 RepID=UPI000B0739CA|nr:EamA family transporter [Bosea sp. PAMC 26642]
MSRNAVLFALMCLVWGLTFMPVKVGSAHVPPIFLAAVRFWIAGLLMLLWAGRDVPKVPAEARWRLIVTALLVNTGNYAFLFWGTAQAPSGLSAIVNFATIPIYSLLASRVIEGQAISRRRVIAILVGMVGLGFLFATRSFGGLSAAQGNPLEVWGLAAVAFGTLLYCVGAVLSRRIAGTMPTLTLAGWQTLIGGAGLTVIALALEDIGPAQFAALISWPVAPALATLVIGGSLMGFTIYLRLLRDWGAFRAGLYAFVSPVIAVTAGVIVLDEPFGWAEAVGAVLMFGAAAIALRR